MSVNSTNYWADILSYCHPKSTGSRIMKHAFTWTVSYSFKLITFSYICASFMHIITTICFIKLYFWKRNRKTVLEIAPWGISGHQILYVKADVVYYRCLCVLAGEKQGAVPGNPSLAAKPFWSTVVYLSLIHRQSFLVYIWVAYFSS